MTTKALMVKSQKIPKYSTRKYTRCLVCGRSRSVFSDYKLCRIHFREWVYEGRLPGWRKASW
ncbi:type Z 30S ribosomal protein S14 [endosymbiont DhMRE of Dentiscutata heterogama]|uniref:type Z 30S ribosomal protein S14 n=1 Tax=endosymbiont DhMRE of Dentiscutata heterogama TaxID=1609546 RepID=UPI002AD4BD54|nr:type Z 30S ribosomal protein S14 [endosymbiont DhMRE of Dentiscutata heterogama]